MKITSETKWIVGLAGGTESKLHITKGNEEHIKKYIYNTMTDVYNMSWELVDRETAWNAAASYAIFEKTDLKVSTEDKRCMLFGLNDNLFLVVQLYDHFDEDRMRKDFPNMILEDHTMCINECQHKKSKRN